MRWPDDLSVAEARRLQEELAGRVEPRGSLRSVQWLAGADVAAGRGRRSGRAAVAVLSFPALELREVRVQEGELRFPYVPGLLAFREAPLILAAFARLTLRPQLLLVDGHGLAHPRRAGLACELGVALELPTIGLGKSLLCGGHGTVGEEPGSWAPVEDRGELIGAAVRTRRGVRPVYVSIGHRLDLATAIDWVLWTSRLRLPEPLRQAHRAAS